MSDRKFIDAFNCRSLILLSMREPHHFLKKEITALIQLLRNCRFSYKATIISPSLLVKIRFSR